MGDAERLLIEVVTKSNGNAESWLDLARLSIELRKYSQGLFAAYQSEALNSSTEAKLCFFECLRYVKFTEPDPALRSAIARALNECWGPPTEIAEQGSKLLALDPDVSACVSRANQAWPRRLRCAELFENYDLDKLATDELLASILSSVPVCEIVWERFLIQARHVLLELVIQGTYQPRWLPFFVALAQQCFINEFIYSLSADESKQLEMLSDAVNKTLIDQQPVSEWQLVALASYGYLINLKFAKELSLLSWPAFVEPILKQQILDPQLERELGANLPELTVVSAPVSRLVKDQYEESPYPRWVKVRFDSTQRPVNSVLSELFPFSGFKKLADEKNPDILIAGSGTGHHPIVTANRFLNAKILAIDLSRSSLGYAQRKILEHGIGNIELAVADILEAASIKRKFDIIEAMGVLHHTQDPWAAWTRLLPLLRENGLMRIGLYSKLARGDVTRIRHLVAEQGFGSTASEIRRSREDLISHIEAEELTDIFRRRDFYSVSGCRDLLFHVQEHQVQLPEIHRFISENGLAFIGFEVDKEILNAYRQDFPEDRAGTNLDSWHEFEQRNPDTFVSMYNFWVQKL